MSRDRVACCVRWALVCSCLIGLTSCDDWVGGEPRNPYWSERGWGGPGRHWRGRHRHHWPRPVQDAGADAGLDAGADAGSLDAGVDASAGNAGPGVADAGLDAGISAAANALSDGQLFSIANTLDAVEVDQASAALGSASDADVAAFAQQLLDAHEGSRDTGLALASSLGVTLAASSLGDDVRSAGDTRLATLSTPDAGALDAAFIAAELASHGAAIDLLDALIAAADSDAARAHFSVLRSIEQGHLARARELEAASSG